MANKLPPMPIGMPPDSSYWNDWYEKLRLLINSLSTSIDWSIITGKPTTLAGYGITDGQTKLNNSAGLAAALSDETGTGFAVFSNSPTLVTPNIGNATASGLTVDGTTLVVDAANDRVGVGTASPQRKLHVAGVGDTRVRIENTSSNSWVLASSHGTIGVGSFAIGIDGVAAYTAWDTSGNVRIGTNLAPTGTWKLQVDGSLRISSATMISTGTSFTNGAGAAAGTLTNAPVAGNPTKWLPIDDNGTTRYIPAW